MPVMAVVIDPKKLMGSLHAVRPVNAQRDIGWLTESKEQANYLNKQNQCLTDFPLRPGGSGCRAATPPRQKLPLRPPCTSPPPLKTGRQALRRRTGLSLEPRRPSL